MLVSYAAILHCWCMNKAVKAEAILLRSSGCISTLKKLFSKLLSNLQKFNDF